MGELQISWSVISEITWVKKAKNMVVVNPKGITHASLVKDDHLRYTL